MRKGITPSCLIGVPVLVLLASCSQEPTTIPVIATASLAECAAERPVRLTDLQSIGSHNSYKMAIPEPVLAMISLSSPEAAAALDYAHLPLDQQLDLGMRQLELDLYHDPEGGRYGDPLWPRLIARPNANEQFDAAKHSPPGFKVLHVQDLDARSQCTRFVTCLSQINHWSLAHPDHVPLLILINAKQDEIEVPGATKPLLFDAAAFDQLDAEIASVFERSRLIVPDDLRGDSASLREAVLTTGWPALSDTRGRLIFALDESPAVVTTYMRGKTSLEGLTMFINSIGETADHAAYFTLNEPLSQSAEIQAAVKQGFLVRTRADADTVEARSGDTTRREAALASGAQYVSTDYYLPRPDFSDYKVALPDEQITRCNPVRQSP